MRRLGVLCVGKDCPGMNAVIRAVARRAFPRDMEVMGVRRGFEGMLEEDVALLSKEQVSGILSLGGTFLRNSTLDPRENPDHMDRVCRVAAKYQMTLLVVLGGHTALGAAMDLAERGVPSILIPCTVDNDLRGTDFTVGFLTAAAYVMDTIDRLHSNVHAQHRVLVVEVRGDAAGWVATLGGMAGGGDFVLASGVQGATLENLKRVVHQRAEEGKAFTIVVVEERWPLPQALEKALEKKRMLAGPREFFGGAGLVVAEHLLLHLPHEVRFVAIGDVQRGGSPHVLDRVLATRMGYRAVELAKEGQTNRLLGNKALQIVSTPYHPELLEPKVVPQEFYDAAAAYF